MSTTTDLGKIAPLPKGAYDSGTEYEILDIVTLYGNTYIAKQTVPIGTAPSETASTAYWELIVIGHTWAATAAGIALVEAADAAAQKILLSLENVDNTSDADKPVSDAQDEAISSAEAAAESYADSKMSTHESTYAHGNIPSAAGKSAAENIGSQIGSTEDQKLAAAMNFADLAQNVKIPVTTPSGFNWTDHPLVGHIWTDGRGKFRTDYDVSTNKPSGKTYYVSLTGNNSNDGLTPETAFATVLYAYNKSDVVLIRVLPGVYPRSSVMNGTTIAKTIAIEKYGDDNDELIFSNHQPLTWSLASGYSYTYQATLSSVPSAVVDSRDVDDEDSEIRKRLTLLTSIADVESTPNSYYWISSVLYIHLSDDSEPISTDIWAFPSASAINIYSYHPTVPVVLYLEGITFYGGSSGCICNDGITGSVIYGKNLKTYLSYHEAFRIRKNPVIILQDCVAAWQPFADGFNFHAASSAIKTKSIEINCLGYKNGWNSPNDNNNGSTIHDACTAIRLNCAYWGNKGPNVADVATTVGEPSYSWTMGCASFASESGSGNKGLLDFDFDLEVNCWLDGCNAYSSDKSVIFGQQTDIINAHTRNCNFEITPEVGDASTWVKY